MKAIDWKREVSRQGGPTYLAILEAVSSAIANGRLTFGDRLPPHRDFAALLEVDVTTVTRAMAEAKRRGLIIARGRAGSFVAGVRQAAIESPQPVDLSVNYPPALDAALQQRLQRTFATVAARMSPDAMLDYPRRGFSMRASEAGVEWCRRISMPSDVERIVVTGGAQQALIGILTMLCARGDTIVAAGLTYPGMLVIGRLLGVRVEGVEMDDQGVIPAALAAVCKRARPRFVYLTPTYHNPTNATASIKRRKQLAAVIESCNTVMLEDDVHAALLEKVLPPVASFIPRRSFLVSSLSKCVSPGLRTAYVATPAASDARRLREALVTCGQYPSALLPEVSAEWIMNGGANDAVQSMRRAAEVRCRVALSVLPLLQCGVQQTNHFGWLPLPSRWRSEAFAERARLAGIAVTPASAFATSERFVKPCVRICLGAAPSVDVLAQALHTLTKILDEGPNAVRPFF